MSKVRFEISMSLDGYTAGPNQSEENPLGEGGEQLHDWVTKLAAWREAHGKEGGEVSPSSAVLEASKANIGAHLMGRNMFGGGPGPWGDEQWNGWWGDDPPFHTPVYVLTHHAREPLELSDTTFHFVTDGIEAALDQAKEAAGDQDVFISGGADVARQYLAAGAVDEMLLNVAPVLLGGGTRLLDNIPADLKFEPIESVGTLDVTHVKYRVTK